MAQVSIPAIWFAQGYLPNCCARHGGPATHRLQRTFYTRTPPWCYILILVGLLVFAIVALVLRKTVPGALPVCARCVAERKRFLWSVGAAWATTIAVLVISMALSNGGLALFALLLAIGALVWSFCGDLQRSRGSLTDDRVWVQLKGVSPAFAAEIAQGLRNANAAVLAAAFPGSGIIGR